jgi:hypothetical protein
MTRSCAKANICAGIDVLRMRAAADLPGIDHQAGTASCPSAMARLAAEVGKEAHA